MNIRKLRKKLEKADMAVIDGVFDLVLDRKRNEYTQWEIIYLALPKEDTQKRNGILHAILEGLIQEPEGEL